jgi:hypothetical protein
MRPTPPPAFQGLSAHTYNPLSFVREDENASDNKLSSRTDATVPVSSSYSGVDTSDFLKDILEFHTQDVHSWLITCNKQKERNERE